MNKERIIELIYDVVDEFNETSSDDRKLEKSPGCKLFGKQGKLDSLDLVELTAQLEDKIYTEFNVPISLTIEEGTTGNPFLTIETLQNHILSLLQK